MPPRADASVEQAKAAAIEVLLHNLHGPYRGLPRTAGWGYPEPYTRDLLISGLGAMVSGEKRLVASLRRVLETLARNQSPRGHIPSLVHDGEDRGASDTTPLFLTVLAILGCSTFFMNSIVCSGFLHQMLSCSSACPADQYFPLCRVFM